MSIHTILGAGGIIANETASALAKYPVDVRLVSRHPRNHGTTATFVQADLLDLNQVRSAIEGSDVVYLVVGLPYASKIWAQQWPVIMSNVITVCRQFNCKLVYFDNVYLYGPVSSWMTEDTPIRPESRKGNVRMDIYGHLMNDIKQGYLSGLVARSADFYGPGAVNSVVDIMILDKLKQHKTPQWFLNNKVRHSFTYTKDIGQALALLGNSPDAFGQVWHLPTDKNALSMAEFTQICCEAMGQPYKMQVYTENQMKWASWFVPAVKESMELAYQFKFNYLFDSSKFEKAFSFKPTSYLNGIRQTIAG